ARRSHDNREIGSQPEHDLERLPVDVVVLDDGDGYAVLGLHGGSITTGTAVGPQSNAGIGTELARNRYRVRGSEADSRARVCGGWRGSPHPGRGGGAAALDRMVAGKGVGSLGGDSRLGLTD